MRRRSFLQRLGAVAGLLVVAEPTGLLAGEIRAQKFHTGGLVGKLWRGVVGTVRLQAADGEVIEVEAHSVDIVVARPAGAAVSFSDGKLTREVKITGGIRWNNAD